VPSIGVDLNGKQVRAYLDTGASATLIAHTVLKPASISKLREYKGKVCDASGNQIPILGAGIATVITPVGDFPAYVLVYEKKDTVDHDLLIGMNVLRYTTINFTRRDSGDKCQRGSPADYLISHLYS